MIETHDIALSPEKQKILDKVLKINYRKGEVIGSSRDIAQLFDKQHHFVINVIEDPDIPSSYSSLHFIHQSYKDKYDRGYKEYGVTKKGFHFVATSLKGKQAILYKIALIDRYELLEEQLINRIKARIDCPKLTDALKEMYNPVKGDARVYIRELDMLNELVTGHKAWELKKYRAGKTTRELMTPLEMERLADLQYHDVGLVKIRWSFEERKIHLGRLASVQ